eukprot:scaffold93554_cov55-Phaeocystis_antarctica.AAC.2
MPDIRAATAIVPAAGGRRASVDGSLERYGNESALQRLRFVFEDVALSRTSRCQGGLQQHTLGSARPAAAEEGGQGATQGQGRCTTRHRSDRCRKASAWAAASP